MNRKAIVTGATGFMGSWLVSELLSEGYEITVIVRNRNRLLPEFTCNDGVTVIEKDINGLNESDFQDKGYDVLYHLAWAGVSPEEKNDIEMQLSNLGSALRMISLCPKIGCRRFVGAGTVAEYALSDGVIDPEKTACPGDIYGAAKAAARIFCEVRARNVGVDLIWTIISSTFGERRDDNNIISYSVREILEGRTPKYGNLEQMWDFLYISEAVRALRLIGEKGHAGKTYGIGSGQYKPLKSYIESICRIVDPDIRPSIGAIPEMSSRSAGSCVDNYELIKDTGFTPQLSFEEGIVRTRDYFIRKMKETDEKNRL